MNLKEMRDYVANIMDYNPNVRTYQQEVTDALNERYYSHFTDRPWEYSQKEIQLIAKGDQTYTSCITNANGKMVIPSAQKGDDFYHIGSEMVVEFISGSAGEASEQREYIIESVDYTGVDITFNVRKEEYDPKYYSLAQRLTTLTPDQTGVSLKIKHRKIAMPKDCIEVLGLGLRGLGNETRQPFYNIPKFLDENLAIDLDETGTPTDWLSIDPVTVLHPSVEATIDTTVRTNTVAFSGDYAAAYSFQKGGVIYAQEGVTPEVVLLESAPRYIDQPANRTAGDSIRIESMELSDSKTGLRKRAYIRPPEDIFDHYLMVQDNIPEATSTTDTSGITIEGTTLTELERLDEGHTGTHQRIRLYPRQDKDTRANIRYQFRPKKLENDNDQPEMPADTHLFLCYITLVDLFSKHGNLGMAQMYEDKAKKELLKIENRYLSQRARLNIKQGFRQYNDYYKYPFQKITRRT